MGRRAQRRARARHFVSCESRFLSPFYDYICSSRVSLETYNGVLAMLGIGVLAMLGIGVLVLMEGRRRWIAMLMIPCALLGSGRAVENERRGQHEHGKGEEQSEVHSLLKDSLYEMCGLCNIFSISSIFL